jgi:hypothetical protein
VLLAGSGMVEYSRLTPEVRNQFLNVIQAFTPQYDVVLLDTGAGISDVVLFSVSLASEVLIVATPEPTSLTDAYAAIKVLAMQQKRQHVRMVINQAARPGDGRAITSQLQQVLDRFVSTESGRAVRLIHMGDIPADPIGARCRDAPPAACCCKRRAALRRWPLRSWPTRSTDDLHVAVAWVPKPVPGAMRSSLMTRRLPKPMWRGSW